MADGSGRAAFGDCAQDARTLAAIDKKGLALMTSLLDACRSGRVTHCEGARLLGVRKEDFSDLVAWRAVEAAVWRVYLTAFNGRFPECDASLYRTPFAIPHVPVAPPPLVAECVQYNAQEAAALPASEAHTYSPIGNDVRDNLDSVPVDIWEPENDDTWDNSS